MNVPPRPRLAEHVLARRHVIDGRELVVLHDEERGDAIVIGPREWGVLGAADGTRDLEGILLAARRIGAWSTVPLLAEFLERLAERGMLVDGPPDHDPDVAEHGRGPSDLPDDRPVEVLPGFGLHCDGSGGCCRMYESLLFSPADAARARGLLSDRGAGSVPAARLFTPLRGSAPTPVVVPTLVDGACCYLDPDGRCAIHRRAGADAKPLGCSAFPLRLCDDGVRVRAVPAFECGCVPASSGRPGGSPLLPPDVTTVAGLPRSTVVDRLPSSICIAPGYEVPAAAFGRWADERLAEPWPLDLAAALWRLADALEHEGLGSDAVLHEVAPPSPGEVAPWIAALGTRASRRLRRDASWRSEREHGRRVLTWVATAGLLLRDGDVLAELLASAPGRPDEEAFYVRILLFGRRIGIRSPLAIALRDRAVRLWVARTMDALRGPAEQEDPALQHPLAVLEAVLRGHRLGGYVREVVGTPGLDAGRRTGGIPQSGSIGSSGQT